MLSSRTDPSLKQRQRGAAFIVMLVIMIMGVTIVLVSALSKVSIQTARNEKSADMLAQAKEAVIGYAVSGGSRPGELPLQDKLVTPTEESGTTDGHPNYNGLQDGCSGSNFCLGRLPWRTLKMSIETPSENDPTGFMPWYAVSGNLVDTTISLNSELLNTDNVTHPPYNYPAPPHPWLTVRDMNGNVLSDRVAFIVIIPGPPLPGQTRPAASITPPVSLGDASQYLDRITVGGTTYNNFGADNDFIMGEEHRWIDDPANPGKQIEDPTYQFNDKLLYVTIDELMPLIEKRIAREVKSCLDEYAATATNTYHRYPWAAPISDTTAYPSRPGAYNVLFGRVPELANTSTSSGGTPPTGTLLTKIQNVQTALTNYLNGTGSLGSLRSAGDALKDYARDVLGLPITDPARIAGTTADACTSAAACDTTLLQSQIDTAMGGGAADATMPSSWTSACSQLFSSSYWPVWRDLVFYQIADGCHPINNTNNDCRPGGATFAPLHISGSGNPVADNNTYRAAVVVAGKILTGQARPSTTNPPNNYLETSGGNSHQSVAGATPSVNFTTHKSSDTANYSTVNDLVLCVDGKTNCQ